MGTTLGNVLNLGFALSIKDISYSLTSDYLEDFNEVDIRLPTGSPPVVPALDAKIGAIYRPVNELRLGLAYHTPTLYAMTETYEAQIADEMDAYIDDPNYESGETYSARFTNDYDLKTPGKLVASIATVLGGRFIGSLDYELTDYSNMKLRFHQVPTKRGLVCNRQRIHSDGFPPGIDTASRYGISLYPAVLRPSRLCLDAESLRCRVP